jgi:2-polyprenyl-3-methyl-5-hydroxy-6-metoxy-1,4-benzoquinol methylase
MVEGTGIDPKATQARLLASRLFQASLGAAELMAAYLGIHLGLYDALATGGPSTAPMLAKRAGIGYRYAREWLEQQAACGMVEVDEVTKPTDDRLYLLPPGHAEALTDPDSLFWIAPIAMLPVGGMTHVLPKLLEAYRTGTGVPYAEYGPDFRGNQAGLNRGILLHQLARWIEKGMPYTHSRLKTGGVRVADIGCGVGWSSIALAHAYPKIFIDGFDLHEASIDDARRNAREAGVADRINFVASDAAASKSSYALVCIFDALHDMPRPVEVLRTCRALLDDTGEALLLEPNAAEAFAAPASETERFLYAISLLHCLPVGLTEQPSAATGTVLRPAILRAYAAEAGFPTVSVVPIDHRFYRLYHLIPSRDNERNPAVSMKPHK